MPATTIFWNWFEGPVGEPEGLLSPDETERFSGMQFELRRNSFQLGRLAAKQLLQIHPACAAVSPMAITVANRPSGVPYVVVAGKELPGCLSLSHREEIAVCAWVDTPGVRVGIDLEVVESRSAIFTEDYFTTQEVQYVTSLRETERDAGITRIWSAKEAVLKALGVGLRVDTRSVSILPADDQTCIKGWRKLEASGPALRGRPCRVWWREQEQRIVTMAVWLETGYLVEYEPFILQQAPVHA